jgi:hypothetical protein
MGVVLWKGELSEPFQAVCSVGRDAEEEIFGEGGCPWAAAVKKGADGMWRIDEETSRWEHDHPLNPLKEEDEDGLADVVRFSSFSRSFVVARSFLVSRRFQATRLSLSRLPLVLPLPELSSTSNTSLDPPLRLLALTKSPAQTRI